MCVLAIAHHIVYIYTRAHENESRARASTAHSTSANSGKKEKKIHRVRKRFQLEFGDGFSIPLNTKHSICSTYLYALFSGYQLDFILKKT